MAACRRAFGSEFDLERLMGVDWGDDLTLQKVGKHLGNADWSVVQPVAMRSEFGRRGCLSGSLMRLGFPTWEAGEGDCGDNKLPLLCHRLCEAGVE